MNPDAASTSLRGFTIDPRLMSYVPLELAQREQIVPVVVIGNRLQVASADSKPALDEVRARFPNLAIDVVQADAGEIRAVLDAADRAA